MFLCSLGKLFAVPITEGVIVNETLADAAQESHDMSRGWSG
jgi:hypothetical protein